MRKILVILFMCISLSGHSQNLLIDFAGQSNSLGWGDGSGLPTELNTDISRAYAWTGAQMEILNYQTKNNNQYPVSLRNAKHGIELSLCYSLLNDLNYDTVWIVKYAQGSTALCLSTAKNWSASASGNLLDSNIVTLNNARAWLLSHNHHINQTYFIFQQGETDAASDSCSTNYQANLTAMLNKFYSNVTAPNVKTIIVEINALTTGSYVTNVITAERTVVATNYTRYRCFNPSKYTVGGNHYSSASYVYLGREIAWTYFRQDKYNTPIIK